MTVACVYDVLKGQWNRISLLRLYGLRLTLRDARAVIGLLAPSLANPPWTSLLCRPKPQEFTIFIVVDILY